MSTLTPFTPRTNANFAFLPTLDGEQYNVVVTWSLFGRRWILNVYTLAGVWVLSKPLRSSPPDYPINLVQGYFTTSTLVFLDASQTFVVSP